MSKSISPSPFLLVYLHELLSAINLCQGVSPMEAATQSPGKATRIVLTDFKSIPMRSFHITWFSFFLCFFAWFGVAPLMPVIREEFGLNKTQIGNIIIASVSVTIFMRLLLGWICDRYGPRLTYTGLLMLGSLPVMTIGLSTGYESFLLFRLAIGAIGASFVLTQYHTSVMFAPNVVGTANATSAGWGNLGGGVTQITMPLLFTAILSLGIEQSMGWRLAMVIPGIAIFLCGIAYYFLTKDTPEGNFSELKRALPKSSTKQSGGFKEAIADKRVWALFAIYGACFGIELTVLNVAALYFTDNFGLSLTSAGLIASLFGLMNIFARTLGGLFSDKWAVSGGLKGRTRFLILTLVGEGIGLAIFANMTYLPLAIATLILFSLFVQMAEGATFAIVPFINKRALGSVAGIVGAGGNVGAVAAGFLFRMESITMSEAFLFISGAVLVCAALGSYVTFSAEQEQEEEKALHHALMLKNAA